MPEEPTREVLSSLKSDPKLLSFLERNPLSRLEFSDRLPAPNWNGSYDGISRELVVNAFRAPDTYRQDFTPRISTVSNAGRNLTEAMQRSLYHELGHRVLQAAGPEAQSQVTRLFRSGRAFPISTRAGRRPVEYFSESFAAYRFEDSFADKDPEGYDMVEKILRLVGRK